MPPMVTPTKPRRVLNAGDNATPATPASPAVTRSRLKPKASASPQVKAAIAAMKASRAAPPPPLSFASSSTQGSDALLSGSASLFDEAGLSPFDGSRESSLNGEEELGAEWGLSSVAKVIEESRKTGRLNLSSRCLPAIPSAVFSVLVPSFSPYHPAARASPSSRIKTVDLTINAGETRPETAWFEQVDLLSLNVANNEIVELDNFIAGFDQLETLDMHNNYLASVPLSLGFLDNLTSLNLSSNHLSSFPIQILALAALRELNLSSNKLKTLYPPDWRTHLLDTLQPANASPSASPLSNASPAGNLTGAFWESASSSATKSNQPGGHRPTKKSLAPFQHLSTLVISGNPFDPDTFTQEGFELPPQLVNLEIADSGLQNSYLPIAVFGMLESLSKLDLSGNAIGDNLFAASPDAVTQDPLFPRLRTLDLTSNEINSLETLELGIKTQVRRRIEWTGLPKPIANLVKAATPRLEIPTTKAADAPQPLMSIEIQLAKNPLQFEQARRRALFPPSATASSFATVENIPLSSTRFGKQKAVVKEDWEIEFDAGPMTEGAKRKARIEAARKARELEDTPPTTPSDLANGLEGRLGKLELEDAGVLSVENTVTPPQTVSHPASPLAHLPSPIQTPISSPRPPSHPFSPVLEVEQADENDTAVILVSTHFQQSSGALALSRQSLSSLPVPSRGSPPAFAVSKLDLSHNLLDALPLASISTWNWCSTLQSLNLTRNQLTNVDLSDLPVLVHLSDLNLSSNRLTSQITPDCALLSVLATIAPNLETLDLSYNQLSTTAGIVDILLPATSLGIRHRLVLRGNKIKDLEGLCETAQKTDVRAWRCEEIDLCDNEIARLPPTLGLLPHSMRLLVTGNVFRVPRPEVYSDGGSRRLLEWLKDRC